MQNLINQNMIKLGLDAKDKKDVIKQLTKVLKKEGKLIDEETYIFDVLEREKEITTGVGKAVAIPHGKSCGVKETSVVFARLKNQVDWDAIDGNPVKLVFLLAIKKEDANNTHLRILSKIASKLMDDEFLNKFLNAENEEVVVNAISAIC
ncbi:fructose PTS transporter subunit IIA [Clostridium oceanicum]